MVSPSPDGDYGDICLLGLGNFRDTTIDDYICSPKLLQTFVFHQFIYAFCDGKL